jgi:hypothetical protein
VVDRIGRVKLTNPDKVLYPATGTTKAEVFDYYVSIAEAMIPHIAGRAVTRKRWPNGVDEPSFFEKQLASSAPDWLDRASISHRSGTTTYPVIDARNGGSIQGIIRSLNRILELAVPSKYLQEGGTYIIPGHGRVSDEADVVEYRDMVVIISERIADMVKKGMTLEQVKGARLTLDYDARYGADSGPWTTAMFVEAIYNEMKAGAK